VQDEVNQDYSEQNEVDGMKKGAEFWRKQKPRIGPIQCSCAARPPRVRPPRNVTKLRTISFRRYRRGWRPLVW